MCIRDSVLILTSERLRDAILAALPSIGADQLVLEPRPAGTAAALTWAAAQVVARGGRDARMVCVHADWAIRDADAFRATLARAAEVAANRDALAADLGVAEDAVLFMTQVHGASVEVVYEGGGDQGPQPVQGLVFDGRLVENIFGYDASGARVTDVRLFDDEGRSIVLSAEIGGQAAWTGRRDVTGERWTNVYPVPWSSGLDPWVRPFRADENPVWQPPVTMPALGPTVGPTVTSPTTGATTAPTRTGSAGSPSVATSTASGTASGPSGVGSTSTSTSSAPTGSRAP